MKAAAALLLLMLATPGVAQPAPAAAAEQAAQMRADAMALQPLINQVYAYPERLPGGRFTLTPRLRAEAEAVRDRRGLLRFTERALMLLADHHAITGASFRDSWAVVPSYADLWVEKHGPRYVIEAVRPGSVPKRRASARATSSPRSRASPPTPRWPPSGRTSERHRMACAPDLPPARSPQDAAIGRAA